MMKRLAARLFGRLRLRRARVGVIGLGYVGLPLALEFARQGFPTLGLDIDPEKTKRIRAGRSYISHIPSADIREARRQGRLDATHDFSRLSRLDAVVICVPTPLNASKDPDLSFVEDTTRTITRRLQKGQLIILESTTYPGTVREVMLPILKETGLKAGRDYFLAYSPEREDPGVRNHSARTIPKVVGGFDKTSGDLAETLYGAIVPRTVRVSSLEAAEATKMLENIYRAVNIALVNELKILFDKMGIDIWEVIGASSTKPFGFQAFWPGPGLGGHCIPIDPYYLAWKARQHDFQTRFIELAGEINTSMPHYVLDKVREALNRSGKALQGSKILILGMAYKKDVDDIRESPSVTLAEILKGEGARVSYHDPYISRVPRMRQHTFRGRSAPWSAKTLSSADCVLVATAHSFYDPDFVGRHARVIVDTRNLLGHRWPKKVVRA